ncbi:c6 zinc finger domain containing protein [Drepanopeziza brunnea f. sp. 'multigermtubi' MB_m1]|uniref:C6 zinc finger domain containing protein n=1 Tax=Marssonina brunnea f. sp. multigermtubi (strain MB_m1) TaxID=1072389 RepID=K1WIF3_MARBU|nr:c6 zinc finger domain containing protein [Drepanopeziza brunnea f. sp. 'multigermtubi' MB_m1]EKD17430.1 c6 zinc finger domain containing protein [Drepanopeziza brunnea f. sp. 'multigermtubi' MB_m1]
MTPPPTLTTDFLRLTQSPAPSLDATAKSKRHPSLYAITPLVEAMPRDDPFEKQVVTGDPLSGRKVASRVSTTNEWDASKTPPSQFQKLKGSIYATQGSRDGHVDRNTDRDAKYHATLVEKGWAKMTGSRRRSLADKGEKGGERKVDGMEKDVRDGKTEGEK